MKSAWTGPVPGDSGYDQEIADAVVDERVRSYRSARWFGPLGIVVAAGSWTLLQRERLDGAMASVWFGAVFVLALVCVAGFSIPSLSSRSNAEGLPRLVGWAHTGFGIAFGLTLWIDISASREADFRWLTLVVLMAVSVNTVGPQGALNHLGLRVLVPTWVLAAGAMMWVGAFLGAGFCAVFLTSLLVASGINRKTVMELISLRVATERIGREHELASLRDDLTGLHNRLGLTRELEATVTGSAAARTALMIDLDSFKGVNDKFGHDAGDAVLQEISERLRTIFRQDDVICRRGGDEFVVVLGPNASFIDGAQRLAERALAAIEERITLPTGNQVQVSASIGIATLAASEASPEKLFRNADRAMYRAKSGDAAKVVTFDANAMESPS